jgi:hypothetical protein
MPTSSSPSDQRTTAFWLLVLLLAFAIYAQGLGGQYVPTNGDEMVYAHIARATVDTGQWLPLASELENMRNTKPPLLIWQAMVAGGWGQWLAPGCAARAQSAVPAADLRHALAACAAADATLARRADRQPASSSPS